MGTAANYANYYFQEAIFGDGGGWRGERAAAHRPLAPAQARRRFDLIKKIGST